MMEEMTDEPTIEPKPAIIIDMNPDSENIKISTDWNGDGQPDVQANLILRDKRLWAIVSIIIFIVAGAKACGLW